MWWDLNNPRYEVPKVNDPNQPKRHSIFSGSIWIGGKDAADQLYTATQTYRQGGTPDVGYWPGPLDAQGQVTSQGCADFNNHAKINRSVVEAFRSQSPPFTPEQVPDAVLNWPGSGNPSLSWIGIEVSALAPFVNVGGDPNIYEPLLGDYPKIDGDQAIWWVMNDVGAGAAKQPNTPAIGVELAVEAFAFRTNDLLDNMTFYKQKISNKGNITLNNTYFGQWVDPDLGFFNDDYVGCDVARGLGLCYNGDNFDEGLNGYGENPPTVGVDFFEGPLADPDDRIDNNRDGRTDEAGEKIIMSNFIYYNNNTDAQNGNPSVPSDFYNYLRSLRRDGIPFKYGGDGVDSRGVIDKPYKFMFSAGGVGQSDPRGLGFDSPEAPPFPWSEATPGPPPASANPPSDRRFLQSAGPFTLKPGSVNQITVGVIWGRAEAGGAQGSVALVTYADDQAQALFDREFELPRGPVAPVLAATELDQQVVLSIQPGVNPTTGQTTETFASKEGVNFEGRQEFLTYRFEGYRVYQAVNGTVTAADVNDRNKARLVARGDLINGVTSIVNREFNIDVNAVVPTVKVSAENADKGVFHTLAITSDAYATGNSRLVNFKQYYYIVVPYSYSGDSLTQRVSPTTTRRTLSDQPYREGAAQLITVIPHKVQPERDGTTLNALVNDAVTVQRIFGQGTGGNVLEIQPTDEVALLNTPWSLPTLNYRAGHAPVSVQIYDPKVAQAGQFTVKLGSRLEFRKSSLSDLSQQVRVGDRLRSTGQYTVSESAVPLGTRNGRDYFPNTISSNAIQKPGEAIVTRVVSRVELGGDTLITLELQMLNDDLGGTFMAAIDKYLNVNEITNFDPLTYSTSVLTGYGKESRPFEVVGRGLTGIVKDFELHDFWRLTLPNGTVRYADRTVSEFNEQLVPEYGLSIRVNRALNPGSQANTERQLQFLEASITHTGERWLIGVPYERPITPRDTTFAGGTPLGGNRTIFGMPWLLSANSQDGSSDLLSFDPNAIYNNLLPVALPNGQASGGTLAPYIETVAVNETSGGYLEAGARYSKKPTLSFNRLQNVDIVLTPDPTKWTRATVLQITQPAGERQNVRFRLSKRSSRALSVKRDGTVDDRPSPYPGSTARSTGMGWFPGYAIDLDRGIRLNMMFAEDRDTTSLTSSRDANTGQGPDKGTDLIWDPDRSRNGGRNFIYVTTTQYDEGVKLERAQDSIATVIQTVSNAQQPVRFELMTGALYDTTMMWVYNPKIVTGKTKFQGGSEVRIRARVNRAFTSYPGGRPTGINTNPEYRFELKGQAVVTNQRNVACKAMDELVRVVPNPYYAFSQYETGQLDNRIKITNIPRRAEVDIYTLNGTLVRRLRKDDANTYLDWNLRNDLGIPIGSGVYLFHVKGPDIGCETVVKWFGIVRPADLDSF